MSRDHLTLHLPIVQDKSTPLHAAAVNGHVEVAEYLSQLGADVRARNESGDSPLVVAARGGSTGIVRSLVGSVGRVGARGAEGAAALAEAVRGGHLDVVRCLAAAGADVNARLPVSILRAAAHTTIVSPAPHTIACVWHPGWRHTIDVSAVAGR